MKIGEMRERAGMTQAQLADSMGVNPATVSRWESGDIHPVGSKLIRLADLFHCTIDELFGREPPGRDSA